MFKRRLYHVSVFICVLAFMLSYTMFSGRNGGFDFFVFYLLMIVLPIFIVVVLLNRSIKGEVEVNENVINESAGIYRHELKYKKRHYFLEVNEKKKMVTVKENSLEAVIPFSEIKEWGYENDHGSKFIGANTISSHIDAKNRSDKSAQDAWMNKMNGFYIKTRSLSNPIWNIKFLPENNSTVFHKDSFWLDVKKQCDIWMNVFDRVLNKK